MVMRLTLGVIFAVILWWVCQQWRPMNRWAYAGRTTLYGAIPGAYFLAGAIVDGRVRDGLAGLLGAWFLLLPITLSFGVVLSAKRKGLPRVR